MITDKGMLAYDKGWKAVDEVGFCKSSNPYEPCTVEFFQWEEGRLAHQDMIRERSN